MQPIMDIVFELFELVVVRLGSLNSDSGCVLGPPLYRKDNRLSEILEYQSPFYCLELDQSAS